MANKDNWKQLKKYTLLCILETLEECEEFEEIITKIEQKDFTRNELAFTIYENWLETWYESYDVLADILIDYYELEELK